MNSWLLFSILGPLLWGCSNAIDSAVRRHFVKDNLTAMWFLAVSRIPLIILIFLIAGIRLPGAFPVFMMLIGGFLWLYPFILYYRAIEFEEPSRIALLMQIIPVFTTVIASFALRENLTAIQGIAFLILLLGGALASMKKLEGVWRLSKATWLILLASLMWAATDVLFKKYEPAFFGFWNAFLFYFLGGSLITFASLLTRTSRQRIFRNFHGLSARVWSLLWINQIIGIGGSLSFAYALTIGKASLTTVLIGTQPLFAFVAVLLLSRFIPEVEREDVGGKTLFLKGLSFLLMVFGIYLL